VDDRWFRLGDHGRYPPTPNPHQSSKDFAIKIEILKLRFSGSGEFEKTLSPAIVEFEEYVQKLRNVVGRVDVFLRVDGSSGSITVSAERGLYVIELTSESHGFKLLADSTNENSDEIVPMCDGESLRKNTIDELEVPTFLTRHFLETGELMDSEPYIWIDC